LRIQCASDAGARAVFSFAFSSDLRRAAIRYASLRLRGSLRILQARTSSGIAA
jgi:hypothetical protein